MILNGPPSSQTSGSECSADGELHPGAFAGQEDAGQLVCKAQLGVRIIEPDQAERHVNDRYLHTKLHANARLEVAELAKLRIIEIQDRILLDLPTQKQLLDLRG